MLLHLGIWSAPRLMVRVGPFRVDFRPLSDGRFRTSTPSSPPASLYRQAEALSDGPERNRLFIAMSWQADADTAWVLGMYQRRIVVLQPWVLGHKAHPFLYSVLPYVDVKPH